MPEHENIYRLELLLGPMRQHLDEAATLAKAAETCAKDGHYARALTISLDIEPLLADANHLLQTASVMQRLNKANDADKPKLKAELMASGELVGLLGEDPELWFKSSADSAAISEADIEALIQARVDAKKAKQYQRADEIREELKAVGVILEDSREGTTWRRS